MQKRAVIFGTYNHLAEGSANSLFEESYQVCWRPFLSTLYRFPDIASALYYSGTVLRWLQGNHPEFIMLLEEMSTRKQIEIIGGAFYSPLLPMIPAPDRVGQLEYLTTFVRKLFGRRPRGVWTPEFAWEPSLASTFQACGFDYTFLPQDLFHAARLETGTPVITEDQGKNLCIFPVFDLEMQSDRPLSPHESISRLRILNPSSNLISLMFPDYLIRDLWSHSGYESPDIVFEASFAAIQRDASEYETTTPGRYLKTLKSPRRAYFPCSGSRLLADRSLPTSGGASSSTHMTSRRLLLRYPESSALYSKMHYVRILVGQLRGDKSRKKSAQEELWRGQCGDAYWHGNGGGLLCLPIRAVAYSALIEAEKTTRYKGVFIPGILRADLDFDGEKEILYQGHDFNAYIQLADASLSEFDSFRSLTNYVNAMEGGEGGYRLHCFVDKISRPGHFEHSKGEQAFMTYSLQDGTKPAMTAPFCGNFPFPGKSTTRQLRIGKIYSFRKGNVGVQYCVSNDGTDSIALRLSTELNLTAGSNLDDIAFKYDGKQAMSSSHPETSHEISGKDSLVIENKAGGEKIELRSERPFTLRVEPLFLKAAINGRVERMFQGTKILLGWDLEVAGAGDEFASINLEVSRL